MKLMTKIGAIALSLAMVLGIAGCNLVKVDEEKDMAQAVIKINDREVTKDEYTNAIEQRIRQLEQEGQSASVDEVSAEVMENIISSEVKIQKAKELGKYDADAERLKEVDDYYNDMMNYYVQGGGFLEAAAAELGEDASEEALNEKAMQLFIVDYESEGGSLADLRESVEDYMATVWLQQDFEDTIEVSDADITTWYDEQVKNQKEAIEEDPNNVAQFQINAYLPSGYKYVRHILLKFDEETTAKLLELTTQQDQIAAEIGQLMVDDEKGNNAKISELRNENNEIKEEIEKIKGELYSKAEEVLAKAKSGADFEALIKEYGEDEGMTTETIKGYLIGPENFGLVDTFYEAALELDEGEISDIVEGVSTNYHGYHIVKNIENAKEGPVPLSEIVVAKDEALAEKKIEEWMKQVDVWVSEADVVRFESALTDNSADYEAE